MPVRAKAEEFLSRKLIGGQWYIHGEVQSMPQPDYDAVQEYVQEIFSHLVEHIDWNRVLIEASILHTTREGDDDNEEHNEKASPMDDICPQCLRDALLMYDRPIADRDWKAVETPVSEYPPRPWSLPKELVPMMAAFVRARRKSIQDVTRVS
jgi:hypothetical protein